MDKIKLLKERKERLLAVGKGIRAEIDAFVDKSSFVELSAFSFSESEFYDGTAEGEGVVCGFATIDDSPFYIVAQNAAVLSGGVSKANCEKIIKCLEQAEKSSTSVIYLLSSQGVRIGEGVNVLEGIASLLVKATQLKDVVTQYLIVNGEVYGQVSLLASICDFNLFIDKKSVLSYASPLVITAAGGQNLPKEKVGGAAALNKTELVTFTVKDLAEAASKIKAVKSLTEEALTDCEELNASLPALNKKCDAKAVLSVFDKGSVLELFEGASPEIKCYLARVGGISVAATVFDGGAEGVKLCGENVNKLNAFAYLVWKFNIPYVTFVNTLGIEEKPEVANSNIILDLGNYIDILNGMEGCGKISVVYGKAIGLGYTLFAAKSMGYDYSYAFANAKIALFDGAQGAEIELATDGKADKAKLAEKYADENSDPVNAAKNGYIDNIIEPAVVRQYLIASLQMLIK